MAHGFMRVQVQVKSVARSVIYACAFRAMRPEFLKALQEAESSEAGKRSSGHGACGRVPGVFFKGNPQPRVMSFIAATCPSIGSYGCGSRLNRRGEPQVLVRVSTYQGNPFLHRCFFSATAIIWPTLVATFGLADLQVCSPQSKPQSVSFAEAGASQPGRQLTRLDFFVAIQWQQRPPSAQPMWMAKINQNPG